MSPARHRCTTYLVDQKAANESQLITATLAAIYAIYSSLEEIEAFLAAQEP